MTPADVLTMPGYSAVNFHPLNVNKVYAALAGTEHAGRAANFSASWCALCPVFIDKTQGRKLPYFIACSDCTADLPNARRIGKDAQRVWMPTDAAMIAIMNGKEDV